MSLPEQEAIGNPALSEEVVYMELLSKSKEECQVTM